MKTRKKPTTQAFRNRLTITLFVLWTALVFFAQTGTAYGFTFHVDRSSPVASNSGPGTLEEPFKNVLAACRYVTGGDSVLVHEGVYHDFIKVDKDVDDWVTFRAETPGSVVLDGRIPLDYLFRPDDMGWEKDPSESNIWYRKLHSIIKWAETAHIEAWRDSLRMPCPFVYSCGKTQEFEEGCSVMSVDTLFVWLPEEDHPDDHEWRLALPNGAIMNKIMRVEDFIFRNYSINGISIRDGKAEATGNICEHNGRAGISVLWCGEDTIRVADNISRYNCGGIGYSQGIGVYRVEGPNIFIERNISHDNYDGGPCRTDGNGFSYDTAEEDGGAVFANNVAYRNAGGGFSINLSDNCVFVNNTSFNNLQKENTWFGCEMIIRATDEPGGTADNIIVSNNLFAVQGGAHRRTVGFSYPDSLLPQNVTMDHNLHFRWRETDDTTELVRFSVKSGDTSTEYHLNLEELQNFSIGDWSVFWGDGSLFTNPLSEEWADGDFTFSFDSPAIDAGAIEGAPLYDYYGTERPSGGGVDIGAFEYSDD